MDDLCRAETADEAKTLSDAPVRGAGARDLDVGVELAQQPFLLAG
jgi:hypothetical protein